MSRYTYRIQYLRLYQCSCIKALGCLSTNSCLIVLTVEGGQRAIIFNRIGGIQMDTVLAEGLHFRFYIFHPFLCSSTLVISINIHIHHKSIKMCCFNETHV